MSECTAFNDELYSALAEAMLLGESVPVELKALWEHSARCHRCLAKLEDHRMWAKTLRETVVASVTQKSTDTKAQLSPGSATLVLAVSIMATAWQLSVLKRSGWIGPQRSIVARAGARKKGEVAASVVEFDGFAVEVAQKNASVDVTVYSRVFDVERLCVKAIDSSGRCLDQAITDKRGTAVIRVSTNASYEIVVEWPDPAF